MDFDAAFRQLYYSQLYLMLGYISKDLDILLSTLCQEGHSCACLRAHVTDIQGKDIISPSTRNNRSRHDCPVNTVNSNHRLVDSNDDDHNSLDSDNDARSYTRPSLLHYSPLTVGVAVESSMDEYRPISTVEKLIKTNSIWLLPTMSRAGAVHILKDRETGIFIVRKSSWPNSLALSVQFRRSDQCTVEHYLIEGTSGGFRLQGSAHVFHSIPSLIAYYVENIDEIPYHLKLPSAIQQARSTRELASLDMLGQDFWVSSFSRKSPYFKLLSGVLHKSCSEPINIQQPVHALSADCGKLQHDTICSKSASDIFRTHTDKKLHFQQCANDTKSLTKNILDSKSPELVSQICPLTKIRPTSMNAKNNHTSSPQDISETAENLQILSEGYKHPGKEVTDNSIISGKLLAENSQHPLNIHKYKIYSSKNPQVMTSDSVQEQPENHFKSKDGAKNVNMFISHLKNRSVGQENDINLVYERKKYNGSSPFTSLPSTNQHLVCNYVAKNCAPTHSRSVPKSRTNLYFTTNLDLLDIQENRYFNSKLSDRLSDYEDVWRSSCYESDTDENSTHMTHSPRGDLDVAVKNHTKSASEGNQQVFTNIKKYSSPSWPIALADQDTARGFTSGLTALNQARIIAGCTSDDDDDDDNECSVPFVSVQNIKRREQVFLCESVPVKNSSLSTSNTEAFKNEEKVISMQVPVPSSQEIKWISSKTLTLNPQNYDGLQPKNDISDVCAGSSPAVKEPTFKCAFSSATPVTKLKSTLNEQTFSTCFNGENENSSKSHSKPVPSPLVHLSMKPSLVTVPSPPYAEPADAVRLRDKYGKAINIHVRRYSAPPSANLIIKDRIGNIPQSSSFQNPRLETIFSPDAQNSNNSETKFLFDDSAITIQPKSSFMRTTSDISPFRSWKDKLSRLNLGMKVLTHNLTPTKSHDLRKNPITKAINENNQFNHSAAVQTQTEMKDKIPGKFPLDHQQDHRISGFSDSSTVQDLIFCANPELSVLPVIQNLMGPDDKAEKTPSEYDNLAYQAPTQGSFDTVYSSPWDSSTPTKVIRNLQVQSAPKLPPAMNFHERIEHWQQANITYHGTSFMDQNVNSSDSNILSSNLKQSNMFQHAQHNQQQQLLLQHQQQIKDEDNVFKVNRLQSHFSVDSFQQLDHNTSSSGNLQQLDKARKRWSCQGTRPGTTSPSTTKIMTATESTGLLPSHNRFSWHCPDVVTCHNTSFKPDFPTSCPNKDISSDFTKEDNILLDTDSTRSKQPLTEKTLASDNDWKAPGQKIREYIYKLSGDHHIIFGSTIKNFIECTITSQEKNPQIVMRNVRQFMTGIKNYLVKQGEGKLESIIEDERNKLGPNEILNIDDIIEQALHVCVLKPLKYHIYKLFVEKYSTNGALEQLSRNIKHARTQLTPFTELKGADMEVIRQHLDRMQRSYSPLQKLQNLLKVTSKICDCVQSKHQKFDIHEPSSLGADDFLPRLIYVIVHCGLVSAEIEADFMWGLLHPSLLSGEGGYCLTTLSSAILILKDLKGMHNLSPAKMEGTLSTISTIHGVLEIAIPDELHGSINWHFLPVRPSMSTKDVRAIIAHKFKVTNPQHYGLYLLCDGLEHLMVDTDCPHIIKEDNLIMGISCYFAFKRIDANIAWPKHLTHSTITATD